MTSVGFFACTLTLALSRKRAREPEHDSLSRVRERVGVRVLA
jgi:hypothetical protein